MNWFKGTKSKIIAQSIFFISLVIFVISIIPATYTTSSIVLSGTAGAPSESPGEAIPPLSPINDTLSIISGFVTVFSSFYAIQISRSESRRKQLDRDMQLREVEILKLELALEKEKKKNLVADKEKTVKKKAAGKGK